MRTNLLHQKFGSKQNVLDPANNFLLLHSKLETKNCEPFSISPAFELYFYFKKNLPAFSCVNMGGEYSSACGLSSLVWNI